MNDKEFNLIDESWIRVTTLKGSIQEVGIREVLLKAHEYHMIAGEMIPQSLALLRCLCAIVHTVISRTNIDGKESPINDSEEAIRRWKNVWNLKQFPEEEIRNYLEKWYDRFWLFHPDRPFYQVPEASIGTRNTVKKLNGAVSESNNKVRLFSQISGISENRMTYAESARWLLFLNSFDDCAAKQADKSSGSRSSTVGWLGKLGLLYAEGDNLFETIMLNMPMISGVEGEIWGDDVPTWEPEKARSSERETIVMPDNLAALYTLQSRRIILNRECNQVTGYCLLGGDSFTDSNALNEPMTLWRLVEDKQTKVLSYRPLLHKRDRYIWRDFASLTSVEYSSLRPGIVTWCDYLRKEKILPKKRLLTFDTTCVRYDSSQSSSITDSFSDKVLFHADILSDTGKYWRDEITAQIGKIEKASQYIGFLIQDLRRADGLNPKEDAPYVEKAKETFFQAIDPAFREWLVQLDPEQDAEERNALIIEFEANVRTLAFQTGRLIIDDADESAYIGRTLNEKHYSIPEAYRWFTSNLWKLYPDMKGGDSNEK